MWVLQQLFEDVQTMKPNSSRSQSSEIFVICLKYTKPNYIDPKLLDPNHVFKEVSDPGLKKVNVLHKKYETSNKRQRSGYDESLGMILHSVKPVSEFFSTKEPIQMLTDVHAIEFTDSAECQAIRNHRRTTEEIVTCLSDLRLLGKLDFKKILKWRTQIRKEMDRERDGEEEKEEEEPAPVHPALLSEDAIQEEIAHLRDMAAQNDRKEKKKERKLTAKDRQRQYLGMTGEGFDVGEDMELFAIHDSTTKQQLEEMGDVRLEDIDEFPAVDDFDEIEMQSRPSAAAAVKGKARRAHNIIEVEEDDMEEELELAYKRFLVGRSAKHVANETKGKKGGNHEQDGVEVDSDGDNMTHSAKRARARLGPDAQLAKLQEEDEELMLASKGKKQRKNAIGSEDLEVYVGMLTKSTKKTSDKRGKETEQESDSSDESSEDDGFSDREDPPKRSKAAGGAKESDEESDDEDDFIGAGFVKSKPGQVVTRDGLSTAGKAAKWFSNPIFSNSMVTGDDEADEAEAAVKAKKSRSAVADERAAKRKRQTAGEDAEPSFASTMEMMPKTDKQARKEQRKKDTDRRERKALKGSKALLDEEDTGEKS